MTADPSEGLRYFGPDDHAVWCPGDPSHQGACLDQMLANVDATLCRRCGGEGWVAAPYPNDIDGVPCPECDDEGRPVPSPNAARPNVDTTEGDAAS